MKNQVNYLEIATRVIFYILAALLPLWIIPYLAVEADFGREVTFTVFLILAAILWLLGVLMKGEINFKLSLIFYTLLFLFAVMASSALLASTPVVSAFFSDAIAERLSTFLLGILIILLLGSILRSKDDAFLMLVILILAGALSGVINIFQLFFKIPVFSYLSSFIQDAGFNVIGTVNGLSLFYVILLAIVFGFLSSRKSRIFEGMEAIYYLFWAAFAIFIFNLILVNFLTSWIVLLVSSILLFGFAFKDVRAQGERFDLRYWVAIVLVIFSIVMILVRTPVISGLDIPAEVSPSMRATLGVAQDVFQESPKNIIIGSGPGTFGLDWVRFKDPAINQTPFWNVRFNQGFSWFSTLIPTIGILGVLAFLAFLAVSIFSTIKVILIYNTSENPLPSAVFLGFTASVLAAFLYPANFSIIILMFLIIGILIFVISHGKKKDLWDVVDFRKKFDAPWIVFVSSLGVIFLLAIGVSALYSEVSRIRASLARQAGFSALSSGQVDEAQRQYEKALAFEQKSYRNHQLLIQARGEKIRQLIQKASQGENVQQEFQTIVSVAIQDSQRAVTYYPKEPLLWRAQGFLYELIIPFIQGAEKFAVDSYSKASELDPLNPSLYVDMGRSQLVYVDRLQFLMSQASGQELAQIEEARAEALSGAVKYFTRAIDAKSDFAQAHFLLAQSSLRIGDVNQAIASVENAKIAAPFDIGIAFQLGLLYYQNNDLDRARAEFERAVSINDNYSNARYFLGLIYDRQGEKRNAIDQFEKIEVFNPDSQEVKRILSNLRRGRDALKDIVPPERPPEERKTAPVR